MTVIRNKSSYTYPKPSSAAASDTESLNLGSVSASDTESLNNEPISVTEGRRYQTIIRPAQVEELINVKKSSGKRKLRRYHNRCKLQTLTEDDEFDNSVVIVMESYQSPLGRLFEDNEAMEFWNNFMEKSEEEQSEILETFSETYNKSVFGENNQSRERSYGHLSSKLKRIIKLKKKLCVNSVMESENEVLEFFKATPNGIYIKRPPTSFERLLVHAIAQYHHLNSISVFYDKENNRSVEVYNKYDDWVPGNHYLYDFVKELRR